MMAHPSGGKWKEFVSAGTALRKEDETLANCEDWPSQLPWQLTGDQANNFYTGLFSGNSSNFKCSSTLKNTQNKKCWVETLSSDDDAEIQIIKSKLKKNLYENRLDDLHVLFHNNNLSKNNKKNNNNNNDEVQIVDDVQIIDDEDCSIVSCSVAVSKSISPSHIEVTNTTSKIITTRPSEVTNTSLPSIPQYHWCILCRGYFPEGKESHERSIVHQVNTNDASPAQQVPSFQYIIPPNNKGYQMLLAQGWDQSKGLGKDGSGAKYPVKTILKLDRSGLGNTTVPACVNHFSTGDLDSGISSQERKKRKLKESMGRNNLMKRMGGKKIRCVMPSQALFAEKHRENAIRKEIYDF